jgi:hypothetical protein
MNIVLRNQIEASEKSVHEIEQKMLRDHQYAMLCYDVQDLVRNMVDAAKSIGRYVEMFQDQHELKMAGEWEDLYRKMDHTFAQTAGLIRALDQAKLAVDGRDAFFAAWKEVRGVTAFTAAGIEEARHQIARGECVDLEELIDRVQGNRSR